MNNPNEPLDVMAALTQLEDAMRHERAVYAAGIAERDNLIATHAAEIKRLHAQNAAATAATAELKRRLRELEPPIVGARARAKA